MLPRDTSAADFAINGRAPQAELPGGHGRRQTCFHQLERGSDLLWIEGLAAQTLAAGTGGGDPVLGPLGNQTPLLADNQLAITGSGWDPELLAARTRRTEAQRV